MMKLILVTLTFGLIALTINLLGYPGQTIKVVCLIALLVVFISFVQMFHSPLLAAKNLYERIIPHPLAAG